MTDTARLHRAGLVGLALLAACGSDGGSGPPPPALVAARAPVSGNAQTGTVAQPLANPIRVLVTRDGAPEVGATVDWAASGAGASVVPSSGLTDAAGLAATTWTLPQAAGARAATATVAGAGGSPVSFSATALPGPAAQLLLRSGNTQAGEVSKALPFALKVMAADQFGNGVAGVLITWQALTGGGSFDPPTSTTDTTGATAIWTLAATVGLQSAQGAATGLAGSPVGFSATATAPVYVAVRNNFFSPNAITVPAGTTVHWDWDVGAGSHSVHSISSPTFPSSVVKTGFLSTYTFTFNTPGVYLYDCAVHGVAMSGTVTVN